MNKRKFSSLLVEPVSAYLELTIANPVKNIKEASIEKSKIGRVRKNTSSLIKIVKSQRISPEVEYQMKAVRPIHRPRVTVIA